MPVHERFSFESADELLKKAEEISIELPFQETIDPLLEPILIAGKEVPNRLAVHPMEGFDGEADGSPSDLTFRRYERYAAGGSGLIWFEATSVVPDGRSNPHQLMLTSGNVGKFRQLVERTRKVSSQVFSRSHNPMLVLQLTHSGRYSKPEGQPAPVIAHHNPYLDESGDLTVIGDEDLVLLREKFVVASRLAYEAGFDAVDIKACHGYLAHELLFSFRRENSHYGGEGFNNRARFLLEVIKAIRDRVPEITAAVRLNLFDGIPRPYGFGMALDGTLTPDLSEPFELVRRLITAGCLLFNATVGIGAYNPHMGRPHDRWIPGSNSPPEHPLEGVSRHLRITSAAQRKFPEATIVGTGYSWLRQFFPNVGAAVLTQGGAKIIGLGRSSFAYPDAPRDLMEKGVLDTGKVCVTCSGCTELMRYGLASGCVVRDQEMYGEAYRKLREEFKP